MYSGSDFFPDFGFAFNNRNFSDRILRIEIVSNPTEAPPESEPSQTLTRVAEKENEASASGDKPRKPTGLGNTRGPIEGNLHKNNFLYNLSSYGSEDGSTLLRIKTLYISSPILAAKSTFFYKLFSNGMMESEQRHVTLRIKASGSAVLDVLVAADKFEVTSCMRHCCWLLRRWVLTPAVALLYLNLPSGILTAKAFQPLLHAAKQFLAARYKDLSKHKDEIMNLPLAGIEVILSSDDLQVDSEKDVYDIALKWSFCNYQNSEERRDILSTRLGRYIRFPYMTSRELKKVLMSDHFDRDFATKAVMDALFYKADAPHRQRAHAQKRTVSAGHLFVERAYKYRPLKVVEFEVPHQQCVVYLDLKREECARLFPSGWIRSQDLHLGGLRFFLSCRCYMNRDKFRVYLGMREKGSATIDVDFDIGFMSKPLEEYISKGKGNYVFRGGKPIKYRKLVGIRWTSFMADDSPYFIDEVLHIRAKLTVKD